MIYFQAEIDNKSRSTIGSKLELVQYVNYITRGKVKKEIIVMHKIYPGRTGPGVTDVWNSEDSTFQIPTTGLSQFISNSIVSQGSKFKSNQYHKIHLQILICGAKMIRNVLKVKNFLI